MRADPWEEWVPDRDVRYAAWREVLDLAEEHIGRDLARGLKVVYCALGIPPRPRSQVFLIRAIEALVRAAPHRRTDVTNTTEE